MKKLILLTGQEGAGKTTIAKHILPHLKKGASFDAENILQVNPFIYNKKFQELAIRNSVDLINNFYNAGYTTVVAGSFFGDIKGYESLKKKLKYKCKTYIVYLSASKTVRDKRRLKRNKPTTKKMMDWIDKNHPKDTTLMNTKKDYVYIEIDNSNLSLQKTIRKLLKTTSV
tara:strand:- start:79 stop:591 length:513 start_codon:yes stop_codon:yes gene_type:complete